jgi:hypothetical protein
MKIGTVYEEDTIIFNHAPGTYQFITFPTWTAIPGTFSVSCSTELAGDMNQANDEQTDEITVMPPLYGNWELQALIPPGISTRRPKSGSCMAGFEATGKIYFLKASNTQDFGIYTPDATIGTWTSDTIPLGNKLAGDGKKPKKGASITGLGNSLFALRGNNTPGFWTYKTTPTESIGWYKLLNIPTGAKNPKDASGLVAVNIGGTDYIFAMKGSKTDEFYLYSIEGDSWFKVSSPPLGRSGKIGYKNGSCLTWDGDSLVYVLKGNYGDFFKYNLYTQVWYQLRAYDARFFINRDGKKKKPKDGASLAYWNNAVFMLKGGNTNEFWKYNILSDTWIQLGPADAWDIPQSSGKKVKAGGCLTRLGNYFYAAKGANTQEFYRHILPTDQIPIDPNLSQGIMGKKLITDEIMLTIAPNPAQNVALVRYSLPVSGQVVLKLYNVTGALIKTCINSKQNKDGLVMIDTKEIPSGVYILRFSSGDIKMTRKLVIEK